MDYGSKNIGLACTDELAMTVRPLPSIPNSGMKNLVEALKTIVRAMDVEKVVLGIPINMDGSRGDAVLRMESLKEALEGALKLPLIGIDERLSTVEALELWRDMNSRRQKKYRTVDSLAAALILERYLKEY